MHVAVIVVLDCRKYQTWASERGLLCYLATPDLETRAIDDYGHKPRCQLMSLQNSH